MTPQDVAKTLNVRYCGEFVNSFIFNDDEITGGSFAVYQDGFTEETALEALVKMRLAFRHAKFR